MSEVEESSHDEKQLPESVHHVVLSHKLKLGPLQTQVAKVQVDDELPQVLQIGRLIIPSKELESQHCDLLEHLWEGDKEVEIPVTNWGMESITIRKGTAIGALEAVKLVTAEDPIWKEPVDPVVAAISDDSEQEQRKQTLGEEVSNGKEYSAKDRSFLLDMILENHCTFTLPDEELSETNLVEHDMYQLNRLSTNHHPSKKVAICTTS